jgi:hypothetical protein
VTGHRVHIDRLSEHGVRVWLDGMQLRALKSWSIMEELRPPSVLSFMISTDAVVWGAPPPPAPTAPAFVDDGREHYCDVSTAGATTPSGKRACQTCGEAWMCSTALRRWELYGSTVVPEVTNHGAELLRRVQAALDLVTAMRGAVERGTYMREDLASLRRIEAVLRGSPVDNPSGGPLD